MSHLYASPDDDPGRDRDSERARVRQLINDQIARGVERWRAELSVLGPPGSLLRRWYAGAQS
jgi:hypothetical protein